MGVPTVGTGTLTLGSAATGYLSFSAAGVQVNDVVTYSISDGTNREVGTGLYNGTTLTRNVIVSTNSNTPISLSGSAQISIVEGGDDVLDSFGSQCRLTYATGVPVMNISTVTLPVLSSGNVYLTPYVGNLVPIFNGIKWSMEPVISDLVMNGADTTINPPPAVIGGQLYDFFVWMKNGTLCLTRQQWSGQFTRSVGLSRLNGIEVNNAAITNGPPQYQGTYVGSAFTGASANFRWDPTPPAANGGAAIVMSLWNRYNRIRQIGYAVDNGAAYTYNSNAWRAIRGSGAMYFNFMNGQSIDVIEAHFWDEIVLGAGGGNTGYNGLGLDATTSQAGHGNAMWKTNYQSTNPCAYSLVPQFQGLVGIGAHSIYPIEAGSAATPIPQFNAATAQVLFAVFPS